jgi:ATP-dependent RNA helicase SUPV3L1/SUV3
MNIFNSQNLPRRAQAPGAGVTAVLGPTNTGKTHLAIDRMLAHSSGLIGLPLRLLAREVYGRLVARAGENAVALITGEEKIKPKGARYWVSTVEAMPRDLDVSFLAIDEIQIAADLERGHVFTDRILNRRGRDETLLLGAATMRPIIERLLPGVNVVTRPRLSQLSFAGDRKITRQPRRTAIVAFSAEEVYAIAELIRRQHGGAAVVLGSLSPRTRNAQVALFQSGDVDYLIATDAIGMGLNLDVDHVAFAADRKYDGYQYRRLNPSEFSQIAGRAGRATRDGTFGTTGRCAPFEPELVDALQNHVFDNVKLLQWRNSELDFASLGALLASLTRAAPHETLTRAPFSEDMRVLDHAARDEDVRGWATNRANVEKLWDICQLPDYRRIAPAAHAELVTTLYGFLMRRGNIPEDWFAAQVAQADRTDGDIDTLSARIAHIRTWTFAANRPDWLADPQHWQDETRNVEDKLSDALHERLTERFVDRRTSVLMRRLRENTMLETEIANSGEVVVEGHAIGRLEGFMFVPEAAEAGNEAKALQAAAQKALAGEIDARALRISNAPDDQFVLTSDNTIRWVGAAVGKLMASDNVLSPRIRIMADEHLSGPSRDLVQARLDLWLKARIEKLLAPLFELAKAEDVTGIARGIAFQLNEALGVIDRTKIASEVKDLDQPSRASLRKYGVRFGAYHIYFPALLKPAPRALAAQLWALTQAHVEPDALIGVEQLAASGRTSFAADPAIDAELYRLLGYKVCGPRAVRVDILERLADLIRPALAWRPNSPGVKPDGAFPGFGFTVSLAMTSLTGAAGEDFAAILKALGYRMEKRPKPAETPAVEAVAPAEAAQTSSDETSTHEAQTDIAASAPEDALPVAVDADAVSAEAESVALAAPDALPVEAAEAVFEVTVDDAPAASADATNEDVASEGVTSEVTTSEAVAVDAAVNDAASAAAEPEMIEVWRPSRAHEERRAKPDHHRRQDRSRYQKPSTTPQASGEAGATDAAGAASRANERRAKFAKFGQDRSAGEGKDHSKDRREGQPGKEGHFGKGREGGKGRDAKSRDGGKGPSRGGFERKGREGRDRDNKGRERSGGLFHSTAREQDARNKPIDPNSPFAKLAALKAQLEGGDKCS